MDDYSDEDSMFGSFNPNLTPKEATELPFSQNMRNTDHSSSNYAQQYQRSLQR
jgi:hypothetical protein